jgi:G3E family GTPase
MATVLEFHCDELHELMLYLTTGISEPMPVAAAFSHMGDHMGEDGPSLPDIVRLDTIATVVDAQRFVSDVLDAEDLVDRQLVDADSGDDRTVADLLMEQVC